MRTAPLVNPSDSQLNAAFALCVAGRKLVPEVQPPDSLWDDISIIRAVNEIEREAWRFTQSVDSVLPYLDDWPHWSIGNCDAEDGKRVVVTLYQLPKTGGYEKVSDAVVKGGVNSLARAMVVALLRAKGAEITFS